VGEWGIGIGIGIDRENRRQLMAKSGSTTVSASAKVHPSNDPELDPDSYALEKFRLYETRAVIIHSFITQYSFTQLIELTDYGIAIAIAEVLPDRK